MNYVGPYLRRGLLIKGGPLSSPFHQVMQQEGPHPLQPLDLGRPSFQNLELDEL
jgi:hypothetical protein